VKRSLRICLSDLEFHGNSSIAQLDCEWNQRSTAILAVEPAGVSPADEND